MSLLIREDDLRGPEIARLLRAHLTHAARHSPPESIHALDLKSMYARFGFQECPPFASYREDPHSVFLTLELPAPP